MTVHTLPNINGKIHNAKIIQQTLEVKTQLYYKHIYIYIYTGRPRRNVPDFGRVFLMLKHTDITQNTYVQS